MTETREIHGCRPIDCQDTCAWVAEVEDGRVVRVSDSTSKRGQTTKPPELFDSEGLSGSGGGIREPAFGCEGFATRSVARNPRPPGYERGPGGRDSSMF